MWALSVLPSSLVNKVIPTEFRVPVYSSLVEVSSLPRQKLSEIWYLPFLGTFLYFYWICVFLLRMSHITFLCFNLYVNEIKVCVCVCVCVCVLLSICFCVFHLAMFYKICPLFYLNFCDAAFGLPHDSPYSSSLVGLSSSIGFVLRVL